jgi:formamidopyrimidine-DNA glycosylase
VVLDTEAGARITFNDARRFGAMDLRRRRRRGALAAEGLGPEPLGNAFTTTTSRARSRGKRTPVKSALLDQRIVAGLGNIYVCEALHRAGISPLRHAGRIRSAPHRALVADHPRCAAEAIEAGGSSLRDYRQADGDLGYFQHNFRVYGREGESPAKPPIAAASSAARCSPGGRVSTARSAKDSLNPALAVLTLPP